jgi:phosphoglycolate phosphatase
VTKLAIFDCDGTLVDSGATIHRALAETFELHGVEMPHPRQSRRVIGLSLTQAMSALLPDAAERDHLLLAETYKGCFHRARQEGRVEEPLFDGVLELLDELEEDGWLLAVATGKSDRGLRLCLESHGLHARFMSLQTADRHPSKPHPSMVAEAMADAGAEPKRTIVVGDTSYDMAMAVAAGAAPVGAAWGYHEPQELIAAGAAAVAEEPREVADIAKGLVDG